MGLAAAKNRRKVGLDPNNNNWARNTDSFGQKMLRAHGWEPGQYLGPKDAPHAKWHTAANESHIRVVLKEDNAGIGASRNRGDQCTGLNDFQDLLGRLNGKSDVAVETERKVREDVMVSLYVERKFGSMRFVKGGWLVGDQVQETPEAEERIPDGKDSEATSDGGQSSETEQPDTKVKKQKKRKLDGNTAIQDDGRKKSKNQRSEDASGTETEKEKRRRERKEKKSKKRERGGAPAAAVDSEGDAKATNDEAEDPEASKALASKKRSKKEKKLKEKSKNDESSEAEEKPSKKKRRKTKGEPAPSGDTEASSGEATALISSSSVPKDASGSSTPVGSGHSTPIRHLSRQRFIAQKRMAFADPKALNQIFMIKSTS